MILLAVASFVAPCAAAADDQAIYTDPAGHFSFDLPDGYTLGNPGAVGLGFLVGASPPAFFSPSFTDAGIGIRVAAHDPRRFPPVVVAWSALNDVMRQQAGVATAMDSVQGTILGDLPAVRIDYSYAVGNVRMRAQQIAVQNGNNLFVLTLSARSSDFDVFAEETKTILNSFTFLNGSGE